MKAFRSDGAEEFFASWYVVAEDDARESRIGGSVFPGDGIRVLVYAGETPEEDQQARQLADRIAHAMDNPLRLRDAFNAAEEMLERLRVWAATGEDSDFVTPEEIGAVLRIIDQANE